MTVIPLALAKALSDKLYDKQRAATHKIERLVLDALDADDETLIYQVIAELATDYATSEKEASRIGGLVALAATAVALTHINIRPFLPHMVPPMVSALSDGESKVRYFACESLYNVAKVSRGHILRWFNDIFDGLARVTADSVKTVKDGADYLDRLVKDIVAEQAATCLDWYESVAEGDMDVVPRPHHGPRLAFSLDRLVPLLSERMHTYKPSTRLYLIEWVRVLDSVPGLDLITYLPEFLDGLIRFLSDPSDDVRNKTQSLLGELLSEIRECVEMQGLTEEEEVLPLARRMRSSTVQSDVYGSSSRRPSRAPSAASIPPSTRLGASTSVTHHHHYHRPGSRLGGSSEMNLSTVSLMTSALVTGAGVDEVRMAARRKKIRMDRQSGLLVPGVAIDFARCVDILVPHLESNDQEIQGLALGWIYQFTWLCPDVMVRGVPRLVNAVLPSVSHPMPALRHTAEDVSQQLYDLVADAADPRQRTEAVSKPAVAASVKPAAGVAEPAVSKPTDAAAAEAVSKPTAEPRAVSPGAVSLHSVASAAPPSQIPAPRSRTSSVLRTTSPGIPAVLPISIADVSVDSATINHAADDDVSDIEEDHYVTIIDEPFNYEHAATAIMELFAKNVHEPTKVSGMRWLLLLHRKAPWRILTPEDMSFPVLLKMLSDSSEQVVKLDLELFAQISLYSQSMDMPSYLTRFLGSLLQMFATDRVLLETRAALMVRQLCVVLDPQMVFCLFAKLLTMPGFSHQAEEDEEEEYDSDGEEDLADLEFISVMVQHLSWILVTAPETEGLRLLLREYNADLVNHMPPMPSIRETIAKDLPVVVSRSRGISLSPPADYHHTESNPALDATQQKQTKLVRAPVVPAKQSSGRMSAGSTGARNRNSVVELDKPRSSRPGPSQQQRRRHAELAALGVRGRNILSACMQRVEHSVEQSRISHDLFCSLFRAWSHNPAACLTLCLLSQHYAVGSELISVFGQLTQDLTVSFLVQLDKLVQLIESPVFTYLRLQLLDPSKHPELIRALYGLLMMLPQSSAFAILRNRLSTVAMVPFGLQQHPVRVNQVTGGDQQQQIHYHYHAQPRESDTEVNCSGLLSSATGVAPADLSELLRLLTVLATTQPLGDHHHRPVPSALGLLQQVDEFQQQQVDSSGTTEQEDVAEQKPVVSFADTHGLVDEYRSVRRRYARALARHQSR
ncbi:hypothetical protein GGH13_000853 [Coemansia sp. S155-1]|nr:hypothetical protein GGH13_000853 [Coemansia sp. S155-1]